MDEAVGDEVEEGSSAKDVVDEGASTSTGFSGDKGTVLIWGGSLVGVEEVEDDEDGDEATILRGFKVQDPSEAVLDVFFNLSCNSRLSIGTYERAGASSLFENLLLPFLLAFFVSASFSRNFASNFFLSIGM